jgi:hypothetical protein
MINRKYLLPLMMVLSLTSFVFSACGGAYGHLDAYQHQIRITAAEIIEWTPPPAETSLIDNTTEADTNTITSSWTYINSPRIISAFG